MMARLSLARTLAALSSAASSGSRRVLCGCAALACSWCLLAPQALGLPASPPAQQVIPYANSTIVLEPYAPNIMRVTLSLLKDQALAGPGVGILGQPDAAGWSYERTAAGYVYRSPQLVVTVVEPLHPVAYEPYPHEWDAGRYFSGSTPGAEIVFARPDGKVLLRLEGWQMSVPNYKDDNHDLIYDRRPGDDPFYRVGATFFSPPGAHYYGLGQNQQGYLDHLDHPVECADDYEAPASPTFCVPFMVTNQHYALLWDNPAKTTVAAGFNNQLNFTSQVGTRVSFFVVAGANYNQFYEGYRRLTGSTPMLPKAAYGFMQSKNRYWSEQQVLDAARGYRKRDLPADYMVIDWFYYTQMGQMDMDPKFWPDPTAMNQKLHALGFQSMISIWPRFVPTDRYYSYLLHQGWFEHLADGTPTSGLPYDKAGSDIDVTNPAAARWFWNVVYQNFYRKGFNAFWADETEPDIPPSGSYFRLGPGTQYFNVYSYFEPRAFYDGFRADTDRRALVLARDAYLGTQHFGATIWSSDIYPTWDTLRRQIPTGLNVTASGIPYWGNDIGGWQSLPAMAKPVRPELISPAGSLNNLRGDSDYPELYVRWFEYGVFLPTFRTHGSREYNTVWSYGTQATPILERYLRLRYQLLPYIYSLGWFTHETGAPFMRALFMDFPNDPHVADIRYEYMFGPDLLVAPVYEQGMTERKVYLPKGADWYNYWTHQRYQGGQTLTVAAPIETIPLFVRAGSILPLGTTILSTATPQSVAQIEVFAGADAHFDLYDDDGLTYHYEKGSYQLTHLVWNEATHRFSYTGPKQWKISEAQLVKVIGE